MQEKLRICDRAVGAFWPRSPALSHWSTMMNLCLVGEGAQRVGQNPISSRQRLALMYIMEAAIRRAYIEEDGWFNEGEFRRDSRWRQASGGRGAHG